MSGSLAYLADNLAAVREDIRAFLRRAGRVGKTTLIAAVKYTDAEHIAELVRLGVRDLGENRVQQLTEHAQALEQMGVENVRFHFIGTLQKNKVKYLADRAVMIHSVDSLPLAEEIERQMAKRGKRMDVLVEINSGNEASKSGVAMSEAAELCEEIARLPHLNLRGFMTMAPKCADAADYRRYFRESYHLFVDICAKKLHNADRYILSMGMSQSFEAALAEGATLIRVGRAAFEKE